MSSVPVPELDPRSTGAPAGPPVDLSVIIVTHQSRRFVGACIGALSEASGGVSHETIVVDNASHDGTTVAVRADHPEARVIEAGRNAGFAPACNMGLVAASGRNVLLLNPDTVPRPGSLARLVALLDGDPTIGAVGPRLLNPDLTDQGTARAFPTPAAALVGRRSPLTRLWPGNPWTRRYLVGSHNTSELPFEVDWMSGACLMARRDVLETVGLLDPGFFMYWEDADWCRRIKSADFRVVCEPRAVVVHDEGAARGRPPRQAIWFHRSAYRYFAKHHLSGRGRTVRALAAGGLGFRAAATIAAGARQARRPR